MRKQLAWLKAALDRSKGGFTMAIVGHPFYAAGRSQIGDGSFKEVHDLLRSHGVRVMMAGDTHDFEYYRERSATHYFVNGGGGAYLSIGTALDWPDRAGARRLRVLSADRCRVARSSMRRRRSGNGRRGGGCGALARGRFRSRRCRRSLTSTARRSFRASSRSASSARAIAWCSRCSASTARCAGATCRPAAAVMPAGQSERRPRSSSWCRSKPLASRESFLLTRAMPTGISCPTVRLIDRSVPLWPKPHRSDLGRFWP